MRQVDPLPAQICSMDKISVLRLLGLISSGTLLKRGSLVKVGVSRWAWCLLARLPERGELTSEEIGTVRDLGKKAVLVGMGLKEDATLNEGMDEVDPERGEDEDEDIVDPANGEELDAEAEFDQDLGAGNEEEDTESSLPAPSNPVGAAPSGDSSKTAFSIPPTRTTETKTTLDSDLPDLETNPKPNEGPGFTEDLEAAKTRLLSNITSSEVEESKTQHDEKPVEKPSKLNTRATVDMIITVAGEAYGQRDLLRFRSAWDQIL